MPTNFDKYDELEKKILELRQTLPANANALTDEQLEKLWDLINEQHSYIELLVDK